MIQETPTFPLLQIKSYSFLLHLLGKVCLLHEHLKNTVWKKKVLFSLCQKKGSGREKLGVCRTKTQKEKREVKEDKTGERVLEKRSY